jgi:type II secretory pathway pseudopilin PulG
VKRESGFTGIEIVIVAAVLAVLYLGYRTYSGNQHSDSINEQSQDRAIQKANDLKDQNNARTGTDSGEKQGY